MDNISSKEEFKNVVSQITTALGMHEQVYPPMIRTLAAHDRKLSALVAKCAAADAELLEYVRSKAEKQEALPSVVVALLLSR